MDGRSVFHTRRLVQVIELPVEHTEETNVIVSFASQCVEKKQFQAFYCTDKTLLLRSLEEDGYPRFWRVPWTLALNRLQTPEAPGAVTSSFGINLPNPLTFGDDLPFASTSMGLPASFVIPPLSLVNSQQVVALEFSPEADWLVIGVASGQKMFLLLVPVAALVARERGLQLQNHLKDAAPGDLLSVAPSPMGTQMMSYLRAHGHNGAKYKSTVAGDSEDLSTLEFSTGMTTPTCLKWWRSFKGDNYVLVGSSSDLISIVHVETNKEACRCEVSGKILSIDLVRESDKDERTSMLVTTQKQSETWYFQVLLEKRSEIGPNRIAVATFPEHFLEDKAFRPRRIKQFEGASIHAVNDTFGRTSSLVVYSKQTLTQYPDFHWNLPTSYELPALDTLMTSPRIVFCSSQLILVQGKTNQDQMMAAWISRPTRRLEANGGIQEARIVHTLKLRQDESIRSVIAGRSLGIASDEDLLYFVHTDHQVYECRPRWSRAKLFDALIERTIHVQEAVFIGYAMGIDMASLCEVVADTICNQQPEAISRNSCEWIMLLYAKSRVLPSKAVEKLVQHGGLINAIEYVRDVLLQPPNEQIGYGVDDRQLLANVLIQSTLRLLKENVSTTSSAIVVTWPWLYSFLSTNKDYSANFAIDSCCAYSCVDGALLIGDSRNEMPKALEALQKTGLELSSSQVKMLLEKGHAAVLVHPSVRGMLRSLPIATQIQIMCQYPSSLYEQRDWVIRNLPYLTEDDCLAMATVLDPRTVSEKSVVKRETLSTPAAWSSDVAISERMPLVTEEKVELFLTILLRLNDTRLEGQTARPAADPFSQAELERLLQSWAKQYRPPILALRCVDYSNWAAAAVLYESHEEWVDAIEYKLQLHDLQQNTTTTPSSADHLQHLLTTLVLQESKPALSLGTRLSILTRVLLQWYASGHSTDELEAFLSHPDNDAQMGPLMAKVFFTTDIESKFPERDRKWVAECQKLPLTSSFLFHLITTQLPAYDVAPVRQLQSMVVENIERNSNEILHVKITRQTASALGQNDPIETHAKVFSCGHVYPKRVFEDDVLPLFEKRMADLKLRMTTKTLLEEYKPKENGRVEAPCPVCAFSRMQAVLAQEQKSTDITREPPRVRIMTSDRWTWK